MSKYSPCNLQNPIQMLLGGKGSGKQHRIGLFKSSALLTYAVHVAQSCKGSSFHLLDVVLMDPHLNQRGRQVLRDSGQVVFGEVKLLHVLQRDKCSRVDFGNKVIPQRQTLKKINPRRIHIQSTTRLFNLCVIISSIQTVRK